MKAFQLWVGIDWATEAHEVCVLGVDRKVVKRMSVKHSGGALAELTRALLELAGGDASVVAIAIEVPRGPVVETLLEQGLAVFAINPKQLDRFRDRYTVAGAKDDRRDAFVLADSLSTDTALYRRISLEDPLTIQLREHSRILEDLKADRVACGNRLREQLHRYFPQVLELGDVYHDRWLWMLLDQAPTPALAATLRKTAINTILKTYRIRSKTADDVRSILKTTPLSVAPGVVEASSMHVRSLLMRIRLVDSQVREVEQGITRLLERLSAPEPGKDEHRDAAILRSLPGVGIVVCATMLAEASRPLAERDYSTLRTLSGAAPVTSQSGKTKATSMRRACNSRLRQAVHFWADSARKNDDRARAHYSELRSRGKSHGHALRILGDKLLALLTSALKWRRLFDPQRWQPVPAAAQLCAASP